MDIFYFIGGIRMKKRIFAVVMAAVVAFAMFGCGSKTDDKPAASTQAATEAATSGKVFVDGKDIYELDDDKLAIFRRRQVGLIYQFYNLIPILNVEENIALPLSLDNRTIDKKKLDEMNYRLEK